jgi:hypothetical protein
VLQAITTGEHMELLETFKVKSTMQLEQIEREMLLQM